jgi:hypothetical protein
MPLIRRRTADRKPWFRRAAQPRMDPTYGDPQLAAVRAAAQAGDWPGIRGPLAAAADAGDDELLTWLAEGVMLVPGAERCLSAAVAAEPDSALALLALGARQVEWAWEARTRKMAKYVSREQFELFHQRLALAQGHLYEAAERAPQWAAPWYFLQIAGRGLQVGPVIAERRFEATVRRAPFHLPAHRQQLQQVCRKWGGSHEQMHAFAREAMLAAPEGGRLGELVAVAHLEHWLDESREARQRYFRDPQVVLDLYEAAERSVHHPDHPREQDWTRGFNTFAMAFSLAGERAAAADLFDVLDGAVTEFPWMYLSTDPVAAFTLHRNRAAKG